MIDKAVRVLFSVVHNVVAHPLMGLMPCRWTDSFHDWTARRAWPKEAP